MIELNFSNMMEDTLGQKGISERQIEAIRTKVNSFHTAVGGRKWPELAFIDLLTQDTGEIKNTAAWIRDNSEDFIILGIGGSALGPRSIIEALSPFHNYKKKPRVFICDNIDPQTLTGVLSLVDKEKTVVNVVTKSGNTAETMASFMIVWKKLLESSGDRAKEKIIATTDPERGSLRDIACKSGFKTLSIPPHVGGRYSVLSPVGLLLAEVIGANCNELLQGAEDMHARCTEAEAWKNPAVIFGSLLYLMEREEKRNINVLMPYGDSLKSMSEWFCQLWAESLGKHGMGITPYPSLGTVDQHSQLQLWVEGPDDKVIIFIKIKDYDADVRIPDVFEDVKGIRYLCGHLASELINAEEESTELALARLKRPSMTITMPAIDAYHIGQLFYFFEMATVFTGFLYGINPFDQPGVEDSKNFTYGMMGKPGFEDKREEVIKAREKKLCFRL